jgi:ribosomal protein S18 acetylase RimI-like enzyme
MTSPSITSATKPDQRQRAVSTIVMGFSSDPITRWVFPEPHQYLTYFTELVPLFGGGAFEHGSAYCTDDFAAASLWLPPDVHSDQEAMGELAQRAIAQGDQEKVFSFMEQMGTYHPTEPHWYLPLIAVDPAQQGRGYGSALLKHALELSDRDKLPAYLEATSPNNRRLYERHGFEAIGEIQTADSPPMWPMLRKPR